MDCMGDLEKFLHASSPEMPLLIKTGLLHVQFESIHPFLDGNGRLGRLLITFLLSAQGALREPTLYLSLYFKTHRRLYYDLLQQVREEGDWELCLEFFLTGIKGTSEQAAATARRILALFEEDRARIETLGRKAPSALRLHQLLQAHPVTSIPAASRKQGATQPTVGKSIDELATLKIVREITGRQRDRVFAYDRYLTILNEGTEPLPP